MIINMDFFATILSLELSRHTLKLNEYKIHCCESVYVVSSVTLPYLRGGQVLAVGE